ncbi:MAG TPA: polysaccharide deacetylase family protein [Kofleriaceae bacterium]|nr:polysaccharide deacetylase family protein [Kofleriaceae bacterium]
MRIARSLSIGLVAGLVAGLAGVAVAKPVTSTKDKAGGKDSAKPKADDKLAELLKLTADPVLGKADRISGEERKGMVAFTFDDGPNPETTPAVIDALVKYDVPATFFIVSQRLLGKHGEKSRQVLARQLESGFGVESHSFSHPNLRGANSAKLTKEVDEAVKILAKEANRSIGMFRAPFGAIDNTGRGWLKKRGLTEVFWSVDTLDWKAHDREKLRKKIFRMIVKQHGGVVLMHDVKPITADVVADVLDDLEEENCRRLADKEEPIWPVSIHYFLRDAKKPRAIPDEVTKRTDAYRAALPGRCAKRPPPPSSLVDILQLLLAPAAPPAPATTLPAKP